MTPSWLDAHLHWLWELEDERVLRALVIGESEGEGFHDKWCVATTVTNRTLYAMEGLVPWFQSSVKANCLARAQYSCFYGDGWEKRRAAIERAVRGTPTGGVYLDAHRAAVSAIARFDALTGKRPRDLVQGDPTFGADHYFNPRYVLPKWAQAMEPTVETAGHRFFNSQLYVPGAST